MKFIIDIVIIALILLCTIIGAKKGLMKILLSVVAFLVAVYLSYSFSPVVAEFVQTRFISPKITQTISENLYEGSEKIEDALPNFVLKNSDKLGFELDTLVNSVHDSANDVIDAKAESFVNTHVNPPMIKAISAIAAIIMFLILSFVLNILARMINRIIKTSPASGFNKVGGALLGCVNGLVFAAAFCLILSLVFSFNNDGFFVFSKEAADNSFFYGLFSGFLHK